MNEYKAMVSSDGSIFFEYVFCTYETSMKYIEEGLLKTFKYVEYIHQQN